MTVDWSEFRDGDRVRVTFEGAWRDDTYEGGAGVQIEPCYFLRANDRDLGGSATSAELIERPFTPPAAGKLFRSGKGAIYISLGDSGYRSVRGVFGQIVENSPTFLWDDADPSLWRREIEVLDI